MAVTDRYCPMKLACLFQSRISICAAKMAAMVTPRVATAVAALAAAVALSSCAIAPLQDAPTAPARLERSYSETIDMAGRLSVRYERDGPQALFGNFKWAQREQHTLITLESPFGQTLARIAITPVEARLEQADQPVRRAADADQLVETTLGWPLPLAGMKHWLQGFIATAGGNGTAVTEADGTTVSTMDGWRLTFASWDADTSGNGLRPRRIDMARTTTAAGHVELRFVIDEWRPANSVVQK